MSKFAALEMAVERPARLTIVDPVSRQPLRDKTTGTEAYIDLYSADSAVAVKHQRAVQRRRLAMRGRMKIQPEELEADAIELLAALTAGWKLVSFDGSDLGVEFSQENARELYASPGMAWLRDQVDEFVADRGNFSKGSSAGSLNTPNTSSGKTAS